MVPKQNGSMVMETSQINSTERMLCYLLQPAEKPSVSEDDEPVVKRGRGRPKGSFKKSKKKVFGKFGRFQFKTICGILKFAHSEFL